MDFSFSSGVDPGVLEGEGPENKFDIRDPSDMANPPLRAKAPEGGEQHCRGGGERGRVVQEFQLGWAGWREGWDGMGWDAGCGENCGTETMLGGTRLSITPANYPRALQAKFRRS